MQCSLVLIIDDHMLTREILAGALSLDERFQVVGSGGSNQEAIDLAREKRPQLIILSINADPESGFKLLSQLRKQSPSSRVIGISMYAQSAYARKFIREGATACLSKNAALSELMFAIDEVLAGRTYLSQEIKDLFHHRAAGETPASAAGLSLLSERELQIVGHIRQGLSSREIGGLLLITPQTVEVHRHNILKKLKLKNAAALIQYIHKMGW